MKIFDLPPMMEAIRDELIANGEADPAKVNLLIEEGPRAIEAWVDAIDEAKGEAEIIKNRINELKDRMEARLHTAERMGEVLRDILDQSFEGKVKTALVTVWNQDTVSYEFGSVPDSYYVPQEPKLDKKRLLADHKAGNLPNGVEVKQNTNRSIRIRR